MYREAIRQFEETALKAGGTDIEIAKIYDEVCKKVKGGANE